MLKEISVHKPIWMSFDDLKLISNDNHFSFPSVLPGSSVLRKSQFTPPLLTEA